MKSTPFALRALALVPVFSLGTGLPVAHAETVFAQDFENGLGPNESTFGAFSINDSLATLNNGTLMMGHSVAYGPLGGGATALPTYSYYELVLDLRGFVDAELRFEFTGGIEKDFDGFNVLATTESKISAPADLITPTAGSRFQYDSDALEQHPASSPELGAIAWSSPADPSVIVKNLVAVFDLTDFDDQKVIIRFQFGTDAFEGGEGANFDNITVEGTALPDTDGDGMYDGYEEAHGLDANADDSQLDLDEDGVDNITEFNNCTDPGEADTDGDGLGDKAETNTGVFVSATDTGSDPTNPDTDDDGLPDGNEVNIHRTDPNKPDTDGDGFDDKTEIDQGFSPTNPSSHPALPIPIAYWPQDGDHLNVIVDDFHGTVDGPDVTFDEGMFGEAAHFDGGQSVVIGGDENVMDFAGGSMTVMCWVTADVIDTSWQCIVAKGEGNGWRMHRRGGDQPPEVAWTGGNGDTPRNNVAFPIGNPETWFHVVGVTDSATQTEILYYDGEEIARKGGATLQNRANPMRIAENPDARNRRWKGKIDDVAIWDVALQPSEIAAIYGAGLEGSSLGDVLFGSDGDDLGLAVRRDEAGLLEFSWDSTGGQLYNLRSDTDLSNGEPVAWDIFGGHQDILATPPRNVLSIPLPDDSERYFVIEEFPKPPLVVYEDNFDDREVLAPWTNTEDGNAGTSWELGTPTAAGGPGGALSPPHAVGTNLAGDYEADAVSYLRSPPIDLSGVVSGSITYQRFVDIEEGFDFATVNLRDAADNSLIAELEAVVDGITADWEEVDYDLPPAAIGKSVIFEICFTSDDISSFTGLVIDDFKIEGVEP